MTDSSFDLAAWLDDTRAIVDAELDRIFPMPTTPAEDPGRLREGMRYAVLLGGKRMRPLCTAAACVAAGGTIEASLPGGCALEMIHAYSLVHDDLPAMDNDLERRGKPTVHVAFGHANAILIGDALLTQAFLVLARGSEGSGRERLAEAVVKLAHHAGIDGMVGGQAADLALGPAEQSRQHGMQRLPIPQLGQRINQRPALSLSQRFLQPGGIHAQLMRDKQRLKKLAKIAQCFPLNAGQLTG